MQIKFLLGANAMFALLCCTAYGQSPTTPPPYATITYTDGSSVVAQSAGGTFPLVGLLQNQAVEVTMHYDPADIRRGVILVEALDGGALAPPVGWAAYPQYCSDVICQLGIALNNNAQLRFTFVPGSLPGRYRIMLRGGAGAMRLDFWVADPNNPQNNPLTITPATPDNY